MRGGGGPAGGGRDAPRARPRAAAVMALAALAALAGTPHPAAAVQSGEPDDAPGRRWEFFLEQRRFPGTDGLAARLQRAREELLARAGARGAPPGAAALASPWTFLGPERIVGSESATGRASTVAVHPVDPDVLYVGGAQGGVWRSDDRGATWRPLTDRECSLAMGSIALDPVEPTIVYAGTGEQHFSGDSYYGCGVLRSTDGGTTWERLSVGLERARISRVAVDPATAGTTGATVVHLASDQGYWRSTDSGLSWTRHRTGIVTDLALDPDEPSVVWIGVRGRRGGGSTDGGVYRSADGGLTFERLDPVPDDDFVRLNLAVAPSDPDVVYLAAERGDGSMRLFRTVDGGASWSSRAADGAGCGTQCWYDMALAVHPLAADVLWFGGIGLHRSFDGGATFELAMGSPQIHVDQHFILSDPHDPARIYVANDGGVYTSPDRGTTWTSLNTNLGLTQFYGGASLDPTDPVTVLGGTQDNGTLLAAGASPRWEKVVGADGGFTAIDPVDPGIRYAETQWHPSFGGPRKSTRGGAFEQVLNGIDPSDRALFIPPLVMDPFEPSTLYFGTTRLWRTRDAAGSWEALTDHFQGGVSAIGPAVGDAGTVYVGTSRGEVAVTRDGGATWRDATAGLPLRFVTDVAVDPARPEVAWLTVSGFGSGHVFRTGNAGVSWSDVSAGLPDLPVNAVLLDPADPETVWAGTDLGVFVRPPGGPWAPFDDGLPMVAVVDLVAEPATGRLVAATHGRGMWEMPTSAPPSVVLRPPPGPDTVGRDDPFRSDSARVGVYGTGWPGADWSAEVQGGSEWITVRTPVGRGRGMLRWSVDGSALAPGLHADTVVVTLAGGGARARLPVLLEVTFSIGVAVGEGAVRREVPLGAADAVPDSARVVLDGPGSDTLRWTATGAESPWMELLVSQGRSGDFVRWTRHPAGLDEGTRVDSVVVRVDAFPEFGAVLRDTLAVLGPLTADLDRPAAGAASVQGVADAVPDSAALTLSGLGARDAPWTAVPASGAWLSLGAGAGAGTGFLRWTRSAAGLPAGIHVDTIRVEVAGGGAALELVDTLRVAAPVDPASATGHLLEGAGLDATQLRALDELGNRDGAFDVGDVLAWRARCRGGGGVPCGAEDPTPGAGGSAAPPGTPRSGAGGPP